MQEESAAAIGLFAACSAGYFKYGNITTGIHGNGAENKLHSPPVAVNKTIHVPVVEHGFILNHGWNTRCSSESSAQSAIRFRPARLA